MCTYVTYESLFAFTQTLFSLITVIAGLVITIVKLHSSEKDTKKRKK